MFLLTVVLCLLACQSQANVILNLRDGSQIEMESYQIFYPGMSQINHLQICNYSSNKVMRRFKSTNPMLL